MWSEVISSDWIKWIRPLSAHFIIFIIFFEKSTQQYELTFNEVLTLSLVLSMGSVKHDVKEPTWQCYFYLYSQTCVLCEQRPLMFHMYVTGWWFGQTKIGLEMQDFVQKIQVGSLELEKGLKRWVSGAEMWPEKGGLQGGTSPYHLPMLVPPPQLTASLTKSSMFCAPAQQYQQCFKII